MTHSPVPWRYTNEYDTPEELEESQEDQGLMDAKGEWILGACSCCGAVNARPVDMKRIELCVNYCEGLSNEELAQGRK